ncbi:MAG: CBS domain-containing protein [Candidatus Ratteibacteria bacterium]|nr:CBS domain-containing protein [Candidatus Ratteibacteria bacterium]
MRVGEVMSRDVFCTMPDVTLSEAAKKMKQLDVGSLPVCDGERLVGMLTDRDIVIRAAADGKNPSDTKVVETMTHGIHWCFEDDSLEKAAEKMESKKIRRLPVIDRKKKLVGIVSLGDLAVRAGQKLACDVLEEVSKPI